MFICSLTEALGLQSRINGDIFADNYAYIVDIKSAYDAFVSSNELLTEKGLLSEYHLIEESLTEMQQLLVSDIGIIFG